VYPRKVADRNLALPLEDPVDVLPPVAGGHVPFGDVADSLRILQKRGRDQCDVAERRAAKGGQDGLVCPRKQAFCFGPEMFQVFIRYRSELFQVVVDSQPVIVNRLLTKGPFRTDDRVEIESASRRYTRLATTNVMSSAWGAPAANSASALVTASTMAAAGSWRCCFRTSMKRSSPNSSKLALLASVTPSL
jgi:hypothetical protein